MNQPHKRAVFEHISTKDLTPLERKRAIESLIFLTEHVMEVQKVARVLIAVYNVIAQSKKNPVFSQRLCNPF